MNIKGKALSWFEIDFVDKRGFCAGGGGDEGCANDCSCSVWVRIVIELNRDGFCPDVGMDYPNLNAHKNGIIEFNIYDIGGINA